MSTNTSSADNGRFEELAEEFAARFRRGDPDAERLDSDAECRKNFGEELHSHFNYERDTLLPRCRGGPRPSVDAHPG